MNSSGTQRKNNITTDLQAIYSPRTTYNKIRLEDEQLLSDLTLNFDPFTINILKSEFAARGGEMKIVEFVMILKEHLLDWQVDIMHRDRKLTRCLALLYDEIDLNGNGILEWDEFTNYVIEKATVINNIKNKNEEIKTYSASQIKLQKKFNNLLTKGIYIADIDKVAVFEEGAEEIIFVNHETGSITIKPLTVARKNDPEEESKRAKIDPKSKVQIMPEKARILDMLYIDDKKYNVLVTSSDDGFIRCWKYSSNGFVSASPEVGSMALKEAQIKLAWDGINEIMYTGQRDGTINIWDKKSDTIVGVFDNKEGHNEPIMDMIAMPKLQLLASCSLDHKIILWETNGRTKQKVYEEHTRGVVSLAFNESLILLVSAGIDHKILVWNPYIQKSIFQITSHAFPVVSLTMIEKQNHFVSMDSSGAVRVWDVKKFKCIQSFSVETTDEKHKFHPQAMTFIPKPLKLVMVGRTMQVYNYDKNYNPVSVDDYPAIGAYYRPETHSIITPAGTKMKVWNALNGEVKKIFSDIHHHEITAFALDEIKKRCLIGFSNGEAAVYNIINGAKIKNLAKHTGEVNFILEARNLSYLVTASNADNAIKLNTDSDINDSENLRNIIINEAQLSALVYEPTNKLLIIGTQNAVIGFYEAETGKFIGQCGLHQDASSSEEISGIACLNNAPYIIVATSAGRIVVVARPPSTFKYLQIFSFFNQDIERNNFYPFIHSLVWCHKTRRVFIADEKSMIKAYDLSQLIDILEKDEAVKKAAESGGSLYNKSSMTPPTIPPMQMDPLWITKAHNEPIKGLEYVPEEDILITSGMDKRVRIFSGANGKFIDSLQQNYNKSDPAPVAYKKIGTTEIYTPDLKSRVDKEYVDKLRHEWDLFVQREKERGDKKMLMNQEFDLHNVEALLKEREKGDAKAENQGGPKPGYLTTKKTQANASNTQNKQQLAVEESKSSNLAVPTQQGQNKRPSSIYYRTIEEEFNPFYDYNRIDLTQVKQANSTQWKLHVDFTNVMKKFDNYINDLEDQVKAEEKRLQEAFRKKNKEEGTIGKHFRVSALTQTAKKVEPMVQKSEAQMLLEQEQENQRRIKEIEKAKSENFRKILHQNDKKEFQKIEKGKSPTLDASKADNTRKPGDLHRKVLKGKMLDKNKPILKLTKEEADAAYKLAAALSNYDADELKNLQFLEIQLKNDPKKPKKSDKNFIEVNKKQMR